MALDITPEQKEIGKANFHRVVGQRYELNRREFMKGVLAASSVLPVSAALYYGYQKLDGSPVKVGLIGAGDEGGVLVGEHNPAYLEFVAYSDIRPTNCRRIFEGEPTGPRKGFNRIYGPQASKHIRYYENYRHLLEDKDVEAVIIALPLHLHAPVAIEAMRAGKHVLCEKLMAWNVRQCKEMIRVAEETDRLLAIGHQRHYSLLYAHAVELIRSGDLGEIKHIRALWHRNSTSPWSPALAKGPLAEGVVQPQYRESWFPPIYAEDYLALKDRIKDFGYRSVDELVRWRLFLRTGGGLMAELGSHQLDACSIFLGKVRPLAVSGIGGKYFFRDYREVEDHVFCTFEFPGKNYWADPQQTQIQDKDDIVIVTYSSISTNAFEPYGECVLGSRASMVVASEQEVMLWPERGAASRTTSVSVTDARKPAAVIDASATTGPAERRGVELGEKALGATISRGYREEMEDFAYCVKMWQQGAVEEKDRPKDARGRPIPRCHGIVALADAVIALTANLAMRGTPETGGRPSRIEFRSEWFDPASDLVPDAHVKAEVV
jgi:predicted dehydrogenase